MKYAEDIAAAAGLGLIGWGTWQYSPAIAAVTVGGCLLAFGVVLGLRGKHG